MQRLTRILALTMVACFCALMPALADDEGKRHSKEDVEAALIYKIEPQFGWPADKSPTQTRKLNICVVDDAPVGQKLAGLQQGAQKLLGLSISVKQGISDDQIAGCNILFIGQEEADRIPAVVRSAQAASVLTVSDAKGFLEQGGILEMVVTEHDVGLFSQYKTLRVNIGAAAQSNLHIDPQFLDLSFVEVVKE